nr:MAG TPA: hypothetical protein [Caudoviricetes sp.]
MDTSCIHDVYILDTLCIQISIFFVYFFRSINFKVAKINLE